MVPSGLNVDDRLTVNSTVCLTSNADTDPRTIRSRTQAGSLNIFSGSGDADGTGIQLYGTDYTADRGGMRFFSNGTHMDPLAFDFANYTPSTLSFKSILTMNKFGNARFGPGNPFSDRLTVDGDIYLYHPTDAFRYIRSRSSFSGIKILSGDDGTDGSGITLFAKNHAMNSGQLQFTAYGACSHTKAFSWQTYDPNTLAASDKLIMDYSGNLHLAGYQVAYDMISPGTTRMILGKTPVSRFLLSANTGQYDGAMLEMYGMNNQGRAGQMVFHTNATNDADGIGFEFSCFNPATTQYEKTLMTIRKNGKVVVGESFITTPGHYRLYVDSGIMTTQVNVALVNSSAWADYVFDDSYSLMPLKNVADYVKENKHLPEVPSAEDVTKSGIDVAKMDALLLKKVEELTLYAIQQDKLIKAQGEAIEELKRKINRRK